MSGKTREYQPKTGAHCGCKRGVQRDNCPVCEGTGMVVDFAAIRLRAQEDSECAEQWRSFRESLETTGRAQRAFKRAQHEER